MFIIVFLNKSNIYSVGNSHLFLNLDANSEFNFSHVDTNALPVGHKHKFKGLIEKFKPGSECVLLRKALETVMSFQPNFFKNPNIYGLQSEKQKERTTPRSSEDKEDA